MTTKNNKKRMNLQDIIEAMIKDVRVRLAIIKRSFEFFFRFYFAESMEYPFAYFHKDMFKLSEDSDIKMIVIAGFRGCSKSTIEATAFPLWAILGEQKIKYVLIISQTEAKAQMMLQQIKHELENNERLKKDRGPFREERGPWNTSSIYLDRYNAKITAVSKDQSIRSFRHMQHRPQLIICDDLEDLESVKTIEQRDKLHNWLLGDVIPAGSEKTRIIILGGILHEDSLLRRLQKSINEKEMDGVYYAFPFLNSEGNPTWIEKFKTPQDVEREKRKIGNEATFQREMMLNPVSNDERVVKQEWIIEYDVMPNMLLSDYKETFIGIDPAGSKAKTASKNADSTAMVVASVFGSGESMRIYIHPNPVNEKLEFNEIVEKAIAMSDTMGGTWGATLIVEDTGVQKWLGDELERRGRRVVRFSVGSMDKKARLTIAAAMIQAGKVFFPRNQSKLLQTQVVNFGMEKHDDLVDAFSMVIMHISRRKSNKVFFFRADDSPMLEFENQSY